MSQFSNFLVKAINLWGLKKSTLDFVPKVLGFTNLVLCLFLIAAIFNVEQIVLLVFNLLDAVNCFFFHFYELIMLFE